ncbi:MAG TPA: hypothetical protein VFO72_03110 [Pyrinomonadaceae bacterium]|nr:hypothetical protein [Pyrinomonadaceae bacterium]
MKITTLLLTFLLGATIALAQGTPAPPRLPAIMDKLVGNYEGTVKGQTEQVWLELMPEGGNMGRLKVGEKTYDLTEGLIGDGTFSFVLKDGKLTGKIDGDMLTADLWVGSEKKAIELKRVPAAAAATPAAATPAADAPINLNGQWEAVADANGQPVPFLLTLKVEGETVTGGSSSQLGGATIKDGLWKEGKLMFSLEGSSGTIALIATVVDGKLSGEFDYAGQLQGKWVAVKKN